MLRKILLVYLLAQVVGEKHVAKRSLLFPQFTILQFTLCFQANYELPFNISHFFPTVVTGRTFDFDLDRYTFYQYIIEVLNGIGLHGETCLLRSICEIGEIPMHTDEEENHLLEKVVHFLLSPTEDYHLEGKFNTTINNVYVKAENWGKIYGKCHKRYHKCPVSIVSLFTKMFYVQ